MDPNVVQERLRRDILESAIASQERAKSAQKELDRQGERLRETLGEARKTQVQSQKTGQTVSNLVTEARESKEKRISGWLARLFCIGCCCCYCCGRYRYAAVSNQNEVEKTKTNPSASPIDLDDGENELGAINMEKLERILTQRGRQADDWRKTLSTPAGSSADIWFRQVDASLMQLQQVAEDMGESLDEQIKLAQRLTIYLNYGIDQAIGAHNLLAANKDLF